MPTETLTFKIEDSNGNVIDSMTVDVSTSVTVSVEPSGNST